MVNPVRELSQQDMYDLAAFFATKPPKPITGDLNIELVKQGSQVYRDACRSCHRPRREGNARAGIPALYAQHAAYTAIQLQAYAKDTRRSPKSEVMRQVARSLTDEEIKAVAAYLQTMP